MTISHERIIYTNSAEISLGNFKQFGACRGMNPNLFYPTKSGDTKEHKLNFNNAVKFAKTICQKCVVRDVCLDYAVQHNEIGIWGGHTELERRQLRRINPKK